MDMEEQINKLINAHKLGQIITPLTEAVEINRHTGGIKDLSLSNMFDEVLRAGAQSYEAALKDGEGLPDMSAISDSIFISFSRALRNNAVMFNNPSLQMIQDDVSQLIKSHHGFMSNFIEKNRKSEASNHTIRGEIVSGMLLAFTPMWRFHLSLYISGFIGNEKLAELNINVGNFLINVVTTIIDKSVKKQDKEQNMLKAHYFKICANIVGLSLHEYQTKLIKNKDKLGDYVKEPERLMNKLVPVIYSHFVTFEKGIDDAVEHLSV